MSRILSKGLAISASETLPKEIKRMLAQNDFSKMSETDKQTLTGALIKCALQSISEIDIPSSPALNRLLNANPWIQSENNGYFEIIFTRMIQQEDSTQFTNEANAEFAKRQALYDTIQLPPPLKLEPYVYTLETEKYKRNFNEFRTNEDVTNFLVTFMNSVKAGFVNDLIQAHSLNMERMLKRKYTAVPGKPYSKNKYITRRKSPVLYTADEYGGLATTGTQENIDAFVSQLNRDIAQMRLMTTEYNAKGRPLATNKDNSKLLLFVHTNVISALKNNKQSLFNARDFFPEDVEVIEIVETELGANATQILTRTGYNDLVLSYLDPIEDAEQTAENVKNKTIDFTKINALLIDERMFCYRSGELENTSTQSAHGLYTNYFAHALNVMCTTLPEGYLPAVLYTNTATVTDDITITAPKTVYNESYPGHFSHRNDFVPTV